MLAVVVPRNTQRGVLALCAGEARPAVSIRLAIDARRLTNGFVIEVVALVFAKEE